MGLSNGLQRKLGAVPHRDHPNGFSLNPVEKSVRGNNDLSIWKIGKFRQRPTRFWMAFKPPKNLFRPAPESQSGPGIITMNIGKSGKKLLFPGWGKADLHRHSLASKVSASARTFPRSWPFPALISFSPSARSCRICFSYSDCS